MYVFSINTFHKVVDMPLKRSFLPVKLRHLVSQSLVLGMLRDPVRVANVTWRCLAPNGGIVV
jgi:hypothetical protein